MFLPLRLALPFPLPITFFVAEPLQKIAGLLEILRTKTPSSVVAMRIRLSVQRHRLPAVEVLWVVPDPESNPTSTIARMLTQVDEVIPLESEHWGLEDYVVQVDGFECLHFHKIGEVLKPGDHVTYG